MDDFVDPGSVVRRIWGDGDTMLFVFAGAAAEFALNRAVDWLFFTGKLPRDPMTRLFSTARYVKEIVFVDEPTARRTLEHIRAIHGSVERRRAQQIPDWAHRDVLYLLIDYSERAFQLAHRPLTAAEQRELYHVFRRVGTGLRIPDLPASYADWRTDRERHMEQDLAYSDHTAALYREYRRHLGPWRYALLLQVQALLAPPRVRHLLRLRPHPWLRHAFPVYRTLVRAGLRPLLRRLLLPPRYLADVGQLDHPTPLRTG